MKGSPTRIVCSDPEFARSTLENGLSCGAIGLEIRCHELLPNIVAAGVLDACYSDIDDGLLQRFSGALRRFQCAYKVRSAMPEVDEAEGLHNSHAPFRFPVAQDQNYLTMNLALLASEALNRNQDASPRLLVRVRNSDFIDDHSVAFIKSLARLSGRVCFILDEVVDFPGAEQLNWLPQECDIQAGEPALYSPNEINLLNDKLRGALFSMSHSTGELDETSISSIIEYSRLLCNSGYYFAALRALDRIGPVRPESCNRVWPAFFQTAFTSYCCLSDGERALDVAKRQLEYADTYDSTLESAKALHNMATVCLRLFGDSYLDLADTSIGRAKDILVSQNELPTLLGAFVLNTHALLKLRRNHLEDALEQLDQAIEMCSSLSNSDPRSRIELGTLLFNKFQLLQKMGEPERALECLRSAIQIEPANMTLLHAEGNALAGTGNFEAAVLSLGRARDCGYDTPDLLLSLAFAQESAGMFSECLQTLTRMRQLYPESLVGFLDACRILRDTGAPQDALQIVETALQHHPQTPNVWEECANIHHDLGDVVSAEHAYKQAILFDPTQVGPIIGLAVLYNDVGRFKECRDYLLKALEVSPADETALENLEILENR